MRTWLAICILSVSSVSFANDSIYRFETTYQSAGTYHGSIFGLSSDVRLNSETTLLPRAENLTRTFDGGVSFNETTLSMGAAQKLSPSSYLIGGASVTPSAQILPKWSANLDPHWAVGAWDFGLRATFSSWVDQDAATLVPSVYYSFNDSFSVSESVSFARSDDWYIANATQFIVRPSSKTLVRFVPAFGRTLESAGAPATFSSGSIEASYDLLKSLRIGLGATTYDSTLRKENSFLLRLEAW